MKKKILSNYYLSIFACILAIVMVGCASTAAVVNEGAATVLDWTRVKKSLGPDADKAAFVFLSVDPARDTPAKLATYLGAFDTSFIGLTTDLATVKKIGEDFGAIFTPPDAGWVIGHSTSAYLIDSNLQIRVNYPVGTKPAAIATDIQNMLKNGGK